MKTTVYIAFFILSLNICFGQIRSSDEVEMQFNGSSLDRIDSSLVKGDKNALFKIAPYLDSNKLVHRWQGYNVGPSPVSLLAQTFIVENTSFLGNEIAIDDTISTRRFLAFLNLNNERVHFDTSAGIFLITPLDQRNAKAELTSLTPNRIAELKAEAPELLTMDWVQHEQIDKMVKAHNALALYKIAAAFYRGREYHTNGEHTAYKALDLLELLTGTQIGVESYYHKITNYADKDFSSASKFNLLIYFAKYYRQYIWNDSRGIFVNTGVKVKPADIETSYFQLLSSKTDSVALNAFIKLTDCDIEKVRPIADDYERSDIEANYVLPTFPYGFLTQLPVLMAYYRNNKIDYKGSKKLLRDIARLEREMSFSARRKLEDSMIRRMTFNEVSAFEYWSIVYEKKWNLTYSAGRILDIYYSRNWKKIVANKKLLKAYLKKSVLFERLGIIGICNNYLQKFRNADIETIIALKNNTSADSDILRQNKQALALAASSINKPDTDKKVNNGNFFSSVDDLDKEYQLIIRSIADSETRENKIASLYARISYGQIGLALKLIENQKFKYKWYKYAFIERDFGFFMDDFEDPKVRKAFLDYYSNHSEKQLYTHYLARAKVDYLNSNGSLNYDKIYELLKYDVVTAFVGGGGGKQDNEVYTIIKLLEKKFNTTLGFPPKLCNSGGVYGCYSSDRVKVWMKYLEYKKLLKITHNAPVSFSYE